MHPIVFQSGKLVIHSYGLMLGFSFLIGIWIARIRARKAGLDSGVISIVGLLVIISAMVGARLYYVFLHLDEFARNWGTVFDPFDGDTLGIGGLGMYGGYIGAILAGFIFFKLKKLPFLPYADACAPSIGFGIFLTRIGCFLNGCCFGAGTHAWCGVSFPLTSPAGYYQKEIEMAQLFPSQLFLSGGGLLIALVVLLVGKIMFTGFQFYLTCILYSILRFMVDFTRYYSSSEMFVGLSHNQIVCIIFFILFGGLILTRTL